MFVIRLFVTFVGILFVSANSRPPFLSHVSKTSVLDAVSFAKSKHAEAVEKALSNYPVCDCDASFSADMIHNIRLDRYEGESRSDIPDFQDDLGKAIFVTGTPLLTNEECDEVIQHAERYFQEKFGCKWTIQKSGEYDVAGFYIKEIPDVRDWFIEKIKSKLLPMLQRAFPSFVESPDDLCVDNSYLFKYTPETGRRTEIHTDSGCLSFTIALNSKSDYEGGGTWFDGYGVVEMEKGQVSLRPGGLKHCGYAVTRGTRYIIGGFCMHRRKSEPVRMLLTHGSHSLDFLEAAVVLNPRLDSAYNILANKYETMGMQEKAQEALEYCLEHVDPKSIDSSYSLGTIYLDQGRTSDALQCMKACLDSDPYDANAMLGVAQCAAALGDSQTERTYCQRVIDTSGVNEKVLATAYCNLGVLHKGEEIELDYYKASIKHYPGNFAAHFSLASALAAQGRWQEAIAIYKDALSVEDDPARRKEALASMYRCVVLLLKSKGTTDLTKEAMIKFFHDAMGKDHYQEMAGYASQK